MTGRDEALLAQLLRDGSAVARLVAADLCEEAGRGLDALCLRLAGCRAGGDYPGGRLSVVVGAAGCLAATAREGWWRYTVGGGWGLDGTDRPPAPPDGLEEAVIAVLRRRAESAARQP